MRLTLAAIRLALHCDGECPALPFLGALMAGAIIALGAIPYAIATPYGGIYDSRPVPFADVWTVNVIQSVSYRREHDQPTEGFRLAAYSSDEPVDDIEQKSVVLRTPFGTNIKTVVSLAGINSELVGFVRKVQSQCGPVTIISGCRKNAVVAGTRIRSCHADCKALDYQIKDTACALRVARTFRGGHSTDHDSAPNAKHFHASLCPREMGARFSHRGSARAARVRQAARATVKRPRVVRQQQPQQQQPAAAVDRTNWQL